MHIINRNYHATKGNNAWHEFGSARDLSHFTRLDYFLDIHDVDRIFLATEPGAEVLLIFTCLGLNLKRAFHILINACSLAPCHKKSKRIMPGLFFLRLWRRKNYDLLLGKNLNYFR